MQCQRSEAAAVGLDRRSAGRAREGRQRRLRGGIGALALVAGLSGCADDPTYTLAPPLAGLEHVEAAAIGAKVRLSASPTAVAVASEEGQLGGRIVRFSFLVADGAVAVDTAAPTLDHTFKAAGSFALQLEVVDDAGRSSRVSSVLHVQPALGATCSDVDASACVSGRCRQGVCVVLACTGAENCPDDLRCQAGQCRRDATTAGRVSEKAP